MLKEAIDGTRMFFSLKSDRMDSPVQEIKEKWMQNAVVVGKGD